MPLISPQLEAAQKRNDDAKKNWQNEVQYWTDKFINLECYKDEKHDVFAAATWFTPTDTSCTSAGECTTSDKRNCQQQIELIRGRIGTLRGNYNEFLAAQANYDKVFVEVSAAAVADPEFILEAKKDEANAYANALKQWFWIILLLLAAAATFIYFKWFRKKKQA